ncbi:UPF0488 protein C8orf33-like [Silurus asotus]|uniref:UPF0488 protein C8orf33-like n=1 Tax=Silurus asotus TaxID=30991 RepID=A0AAD5AZ23_SILAS|nr:UPF0488 protein C8orf33-like [Silurus asotus]
MESETGSGFAFNFQTPAAAAQTEAEPDPSAGGTQTGEAARDSKPNTKKKKKKKKKSGTLRSSKAPVVKKRQVMRAVSGDYRKKMEEDRERQQKLIRSAMSSATVTRVSEPRCRAAYTRHVPTRQPAAHAPDVGPPPLPAEQTGGDGFVLRPSGQEFRFNFDV